MTRSLALWQKLASKPLGKWLFTRIICWRAPYFSSIRPSITDLRAGYCEARLKKRRAVHNHIGTVHAIACCNLAELTAGVVSEATVPEDFRWIPKGMTVEYRAKAATDLRATARWPHGIDYDRAQDVVVDVDVSDTAGTVVVHADITMYVSPRESK